MNQGCYSSRPKLAATPRFEGQTLIYDLPRDYRILRVIGAPNGIPPSLCVLAPEEQEDFVEVVFRAVELNPGGYRSVPEGYVVEAAYQDTPTMILLRKVL